MDYKIALFSKRPIMTLVIILVFTGLMLTSGIVLAEVSVPQVDQTNTTPLSIPNPGTSDPRYLSGFGSDNSYTIFYEDRRDFASCPYGSRIYFVQTIDGPLNFSPPVRTNICDTHLVVKNWPITIGGTDYYYRAWGSRGNNSQHNFHVSTDMINWVTNPITSTPFTFSDPSVFYGFHDIVQINNNYMGFAETNGSRTVLVLSDLGTNVWNVVGVVGGVGVGPLDLDVGLTGPTPTGSFVLMEVHGQQVYGKLGVPGDDSGAYLAINSAIVQAGSPAAAETAFLTPGNWTWSEGNTGVPTILNRVLDDSGGHNVSEVWTVPLSNYRSDHVIFYTGSYVINTSDMGCAATNPECLVVDPPPLDQAALPETGFTQGLVTELPSQPKSKSYTDTELILEIPSLDLELPIVGVPRGDASWDVTWLGENAGYLADSAFPTWTGNTVITGHVWDSYNQPGPFFRIKSLSFGDQVNIEAWGKTYIYEVRDQKLVFSNQVNTVFTPEEYDWITLVTCEFFNPITKNYLFRRAVRAVLVDIQ